MAGARLPSLATRLFQSAVPTPYYALAFLCSAAILFLRSLPTFLHPTAGWEDATQGLNYYTSSNANILHFYAGYISFLPNVVDWASVKLLPLQAVPFVQAYFALAAAACIAPALISFLVRIVHWQPRDAAVVATLITCLPWGDVAGISNTEFSIWSLLAILLLTMLNPVPTSPGGRFGFVLWRGFIIASNPLSIVCVPVWCWLAWRERYRSGPVVAYIGLLMVNSAYLRYGIDPASGAAFDLHRSLEGFDAALRLATEKSFLAITVRDILRINFGLVHGYIAAIALILIVLLIWNVLPKPAKANPQTRFALAFLLGLIAAVCLACGLGRGAANGAAFVLGSPRYHYVPQMLWLTVLAVVLQARACSLRRSRVPFLLLVLVCLGLMSEKGLKAYRSDDYTDSARVIHFLQSGEAARKSGTASEIRYNRIGPDGDWSLVLFSSRLANHSF
jgi:hypothetical protein